MKLLAALLTLPLAACGPSAGDPAAGGVSAGEAQALNDAAATLEDNGSDAVIETNDTGDNAVAKNAQ